MDSAMVTVDLNKTHLLELKLFWENFLQCSNDTVKVDWLELFLFKYEILIECPEFIVDNQHFLSSVPSQLSCYLLKLVYGIISVHSVPPSANASNPNDSISNSTITIVTKNNAENHDHLHDVFGDLFRSTSKSENEKEADNTAKSNDITAIAALREFLVKGTGGRILHVLESIDTKGLLCAKELATLLMSLFPTNPWEIEKTKSTVFVLDGVREIKQLKTAIEDLEFQSLFTSRMVKLIPKDTSSPDKGDKLENTDKCDKAYKRPNSETSDESDHDSRTTRSKGIPAPLLNNSDCSDTKRDGRNDFGLYQSAEFEAHQQKVMTGDYVASTILNIVVKLIAEENASTLNHTSATVQALWFGITQCNIIEKNRPFQSQNQELLKRNLVMIIYTSLHKIYSSGKKLEELVDTNQLIIRLIDALQDDCQKDSILRRKTSKITNSLKKYGSIMEIKTENMKALLYGIFLIAQHLLVKRTEGNNMYDMLFNAIQTRVQILTKAISILVRYQPADRQDVMDRIWPVIFKLIESLNSVAAQQIKQKKSTKKRKQTVVPVAATHHQSYISFRCTLEMILLHAAQSVNADRLHIILDFLLKHTICCCNIQLGIIHRILFNSLQHNLHQLCLHFIKLNVLRTIYNNDMRCGNCDSSKFIFKFKDDFVTLYKNWFRALRLPKDIIVFLRHIAKISKYPQVDVQSHILVDIVLPLFRKEKYVLMYEAEHLQHNALDADSESIKTNHAPNGITNGFWLNRTDVDRELSDKIIINCLNIFLCYLKDVTVIKAFFIEENIQHLEDLFARPQFAYLVSNIFKIGIDNGAFLGETNDECLALCNRLQSLQIDAFLNIIDVLIKLFDDVATLQNLPLKKTNLIQDHDQHESIFDSCKTPTVNPILEKLLKKQLTAYDILDLSVVYWNSILQIIRSKNDEFKSTMQEAIQTYDNIVFNIVYNSLSCVLFAVKQNVDMEAERQQLHESLTNGHGLVSDANAINQDEWKIGWLKNGEFDCDNNILFRKEQSMIDIIENGHNDERMPVNCENNVDNVQLNGLVNSAHSDIPNGVLHIKDDMDFRTVFDSSNSENDHVDNIHLSNGVCDKEPKVLVNGDESMLNLDNDTEKSLIYSVKNTKCETLSNGIGLINTKSNENPPKLNGSSGGPARDQDDNHTQLFLNGVQKINEFINTNVISILISTAISTIGNKQYDNETVITEQTRIPQFFHENELMLVHSSNHKRLLVQLFEITLGVMMCDSNGHESNVKMNQALQQLKALLLSKSLQSFDVEQGQSIVNTLHSLLKVADMRSKCCIMDDCAHPTLAQKNKFSVNILPTNDSLFKVSVRTGSQRDFITADYDGQSDEETASDNSFDTAEEGYEGDAELAKHVDTDNESDWNNMPKTPTPPFRNHIVHEGICRVVTDILIDLSKRCLENPAFWASHLLQIASRLVGIRDLIGGSQHILRGFSLVLESSDVRLRDFQKSILELITDLNTPDTFCNYISLMTSPDPPLDALLPTLINLGTNSQSIKPSIEIEFPVASADSIKYTCDKIIYDDIKKIYDNLETQNIRSPITQAAYIVPLNFMDFKPWTYDGFTLTSWLRINPETNLRSESADNSLRLNNHVEDGLIEPDLCSPYCFFRNKVHLLTVGTSSLLLSIYICINDINTLYFQLSNPGAQTSRVLSKSNSDYFRQNDGVLKSKPKRKCVCVMASRKRNMRNGEAKFADIGGKDGKRRHKKTVTIETDVNGIGQPSASTLNGIGSNVISQTIHNTKQALKSSLSHFSLFSSNRNNDLDAEFNMMGHPLELKGAKLQINTWMLLSVAANFTGADILIKVKIDNSDTFTLTLPCSYSQTSSKYEKFKVICIGSKADIVPDTISDTTSSDESINTSLYTIAEKQMFKYSLSNVLLFRKGLHDNEIFANLFALGPDCVNFTQCQIGNIIPNLGISSCSKIPAKTPTADILKHLRENLVVAYSAHTPDMIIGYNTYDDHLDIEGVPIGLISLGNEAIPKYVPSFQTAVFLSGGLSPLLYLFARVVELSKSDTLQSAALSFFLKTAHSNSVLYSEFIKKNYIGLLGPVIRSSKCIKSIHLLNSILETACSMPVIGKGPDGFEVQTQKNVCIVYPELFIAVINHYSDWHNPKNDNCQIIEMLFQVIQALVSEKHMYQELNMSRLNKANLVPALLNFCKVHLTDGTHSIFLSKKAADSLINIISIFAGAPPKPVLLDDIVKVLLMLHRPSDSFVTHDRSKFYFLLTSAQQTKTKKLSLPLGARKINLTMKKDIPINRKAKSPVGSPANRILHARSSSLDRDTPQKNDNFKRFHSEDKSKSSDNQSELNSNDSSHSTETDFNTAKDTNGFDSSDNINILSRSPNIERKSTVVLNGNDKLKFEKALSQINFKRQHGHKKRLNHKRKQSTRSRSRSITESEADRAAKDKKTNRRQRAKSEGSGVGKEKELEFIREYDIIAEEDIRKIEEIYNDRDERLVLPSVIQAETAEGIIHIQNGLLKLLRDFILILPDTTVGEVLMHFVTFDIVLVLANNQNSSVRASIILLLSVMCERHVASTKTTNLFNLGNQIALHQAEFPLVQACVQWVTGSLLNIDQLLEKKIHLKIAQKFGLNALIAIIPQTLHDINLATSVIKFVTHLYKCSDQEKCSYMIENGLLPSIVRMLLKIHLGTELMYEKLTDAMQDLLNTIAFRAISTAGCINVLWDLLNGITYVEQNRSGSIHRGIRTAHANILFHLLKSFFTKKNNPSLSSFKFTPSELNLYDSILSINEKQTRLELLLDRIVQFLRNAPMNHSLSPQESSLIESTVMLTVNGISRTASILPWSLRPGKPMPIKLFVIKMLSKYTKNGELPINGCDIKIFKTMVHAFLHSDREIIPVHDREILSNVCTLLGIKQSDTNSYLPHATAKMDLNRENSIKEQKPYVERSVFKFEATATACIESAMKVTRDVVAIQNSERRGAMAHMRFHDENCLSKEWHLIIDRMTHEGAPWHCARNYSSSWELDQTEGPDRVRLRMKRSNLNIPSRFFRTADRDSNVNLESPEPLSYLTSTLNQRSHCTLSDQVLYTFPCKHLPVDTEVDGEMILTEFNLIFIANNNAQKTINVEVNSITDIWLRRYQHNENGMEFFMDTNTSLFFILQSMNDREVLKTYFADRLSDSEAKLSGHMQKWREGAKTNWEYLIALNLISGRSYQDLMQYPVFPWILSDYESYNLDLNAIESYRDLSKPIAIQHPDNKEHYINSYNYLSSIYSSSNQLAPYHYGSHYSNSGTVLHFLVRIPPFTRYFLRYQDNNFDLPDRTFHSLLTTWRLASRDSTTDVKELIPEFFSFFEFLENSQKFNFGYRQSGEAVDNVSLPPWARDSSRIFSLVHRQALESDVTRRNLHNWIDLVFGYKQTGQAAVDAVNVFHPATYYGFSLCDASDPVERTAMETMVRTYGQMPKQLFKMPHPNAQSITTTNECYPPVMQNIKGLRWGCYTGSPELPDPRVCGLYQQFEVNFSTLMSMPRTNCIYALSQGHSVMQGTEPDTTNIIQWQKKDGVIRIKPLRDSEIYEHQPLTYNHHIDGITSCGTDPNSNQLWFGHVSGRITVYQCIMKQTSKRSSQMQTHNSAFRKMSQKLSGIYNTENDLDGKNRAGDARSIQWKDPVILLRHTNTVTAIHISIEFKIVVSVSNDGYAVLWDANHLQYVRTIQRSSICKGPISLATVSPTLGDIVTVHIMHDGPYVDDDQFSDCYEATENIDDFVNVTADVSGKSLLRLHTINAKYIAHVTIPEKILSICYSFVKEGVGVNVIAAGLEKGIIRLWSSWDLAPIREFLVSNFDVISITYTTYQHLVVLTSDNIIQVWDTPGLHGNPPKFPQVVFQQHRNGV